jgi:hypothetical protein
VSVSSPVFAISLLRAGAVDRLPVRVRCDVLPLPETSMTSTLL